MTKNKIYRIIKNIHPEAYIWFVAIALLSFANPYDHHFTICPIANLGFDWCPGCGLGRSIALFFRGDLVESFKMHPLGMVGLLLLSYRIVSLIRLSINTIQNEEQENI